MSKWNRVSRRLEMAKLNYKNGKVEICWFNGWRRLLNKLIDEIWEGEK